MAGYSVVSSRYAHSLLGLANERGVTEEVFTDMKSLQTAYHNSEELRAFLKSPVININTKKSALDKAFTGSLTQLSMLFLEKLCEARREMYIGEIAQSFITAYKTQKGVVSAKVVTAVPLTDKIREEVISIIRRNAEYAGASSIEIDEKVDKNILGGIIISVGDKQVDASFSRKINEYKMAFSDNLYVKEF